MNENQQFNNKGYIIKRNFINSKEFYNFCDFLNKEIKNKYDNTDLSQFGGYKIGNLYINIGNNANILWDLLIKKNLAEFVENVLGKPLNEFSLKLSGNLSLPNKGEQDFHIDGGRKFLLSIATEDIDEKNGPTEVVENCSNNIPYWKFILKKKIKKKIILKKGDLIIRKSSCWHRGTKNNTQNPRFLIAFLLSENKPVKRIDFSKTKEIYFDDNFFNQTKLGNIKESIYVNFKIIFKTYKFLRSIFIKSNHI